VASSRTRVWGFKQHPGQCNLLGLGAAEGVCAEVGIQSVRQLVDPVGADVAEGGEQPVVGGVGSGDCQVVAEGVGEDVVFLGDEDDVFAELFGWKVRDDGATDGD